MTLWTFGRQVNYMPWASLIHPIHAAAMLNRMRGLKGKYVRQYTNRGVT